MGFFLFGNWYKDDKNIQYIIIAHILECRIFAHSLGYSNK